MANAANAVSSSGSIGRGSARHRDRFKARTMRKQASAFRQQRDTAGEAE
jgi:hypothetical protein